MPNLTTVSTNNTCYLCGCQAHYISFNSKKMRCVEKITQCPGFIKKAEASRQRNLSADQRRDHMKNMSKKGNEVLKELHTDKKWVSSKGNKISNAIKSRGGHSGANNPMFGKSHKQDSLELLIEKAKNRNPNCYSIATETKIAKGIAVPKEQKTAWDLYREQVFKITYKSWKIYHDKINPMGLLRGSNYELDHKFSITEGFKQNIDPKIIGHYTNLELISKKENRSKRTRCSITLDELIKLQQTK